jgi:predicted RNA-binding protein with PIN domain
MRKVLIDGNNLLYRVPETSRLASDDFEAAKRLLCRMLSDYAGRSQARITVVFDGYAGTGQRFGTEPEVRAIHTISPETADQRIIKMLKRAEDPASLCVVSDDRAGVETPARELGARVVSSTSFAASLSRRGSSREVLQEKPAADVSPHEVDDWLEFFGEKKG